MSRFTVLLLTITILCGCTVTANQHQAKHAISANVDRITRQSLNPEQEDVALLEMTSMFTDPSMNAPPTTQTEHPTAAATSSGGAGGNLASEAATLGACEVCVYVVENKEQHQPYLCRGLHDPNYQKACVQTLESLMWWLTNEVYWLNYGCQRTEGAREWVRPCPAHAVCSWIENLYSKQPFCPPDPAWAKPQ